MPLLDLVIALIVIGVGLYVVNRSLLSKTGMEKMTHAANEDLWVSGTGVLRLRSASLG